LTEYLTVPNLEGLTALLFPDSASGIPISSEYFQLILKLMMTKTRELMSRNKKFS